jgi:hypothetical protein
MPRLSGAPRPLCHLRFLPQPQPPEIQRQK